jgi:hypothetical protein
MCCASTATLILTTESVHQNKKEKGRDNASYNGRSLRAGLGKWTMVVPVSYFFKIHGHGSLCPPATASEQR